jgi:hypothetical protein
VKEILWNFSDTGDLALPGKRQGWIGRKKEKN